MWKVESVAKGWPAGSERPWKRAGFGVAEGTLPCCGSAGLGGVWLVLADTLCSLEDTWWQ